MTYKQFQQLPETITRAQFCAATGIPARTVNQMRSDGSLRAWRVPGRSNSRHRYLKSEVARVLGWTYEGPTPRVPPVPANGDHSHAR